MPTFGVAAKVPRSMMPDDLDQVASGTSEDVEIADIRVAAQGLLHLQRQSIHALGHHGPSLVVVSEGLKAQEETGVRRWGAELRRLEGIALAGLNPLEEAQNAFAEALRIARFQQAKSYELRAATSCARLMCDQGRTREARDLLAPIYGSFTEGFDTADLKEAKALLEQLAP
jgi:hypothetical protein